MARSGWAALAATILLVAGLGSEPALDAAADADRQVAPLLRSLTAFPAWSASALGFDSDMYTAIAVKIVVLLVLVFVLGRAAGHVGASFAAFLAGWGALMIAGAVAGVAYVVVADMAVLDGQLADSQGGAGAVVVDGLNQGVVFGLYTGWLVGVVVVMTARPSGLQATGGWRASPPSRTLPVPPAGDVAGAAVVGTAAATGVGAPPSDPMAGINLVPGMPSVPSSGRAHAGAADGWTQAAPEPVTRSGAADPWGGRPPGSGQPAPDWAVSPPPAAAAPGAEDPWGPQPLSDPAVRSAPADGPWAPQLQSTADAATAAGSRGAMGEPGPWATPPDPAGSTGSTEGQPFVPSGGWRRPPAEAVGSVPTAENPAVPTGSWPPSVPSAPEPPAAPGGPIVPTGTWPPSALPAPDAAPPSPSYEQPEYSGLAPSRPTTPDPSTEPGPPSVDADAEADQPTRPLWPSAWPATSGGAYADDPDKPDKDDADGNTDHDQPDGAKTRFW